MKTIFILHGWAIRGGEENQRMWQPFINELELSDSQVVFLKIPGLSVPLNEVWDMDNYLSWLESEIAQKSKGEKVILLGHSFGGHLAIKYAARNPEKMEKLILVDSSGIRDMVPKAVIKRTIFLMLAKVGKIFFKSEFFRNMIYKFARESDYKNAPPLLRRTMSKILDDEILEELPKVKCDTKIIWGENDLTTPVKHAKKMQAEIKNSELIFIKEGKHSPQFTHVKETAKLVMDFVLENDTSRQKRDKYFGDYK
ncbi:alpha/beta hydrolase [Patescibacteria group bacterium]|nr:alpha/beta hydrolase [Patescibacteria group bacterium]